MKRFLLPKDPVEAKNLLIQRKTLLWGLLHRYHMVYVSNIVRVIGPFHTRADKQVTFRGRKVWPGHICYAAYVPPTTYTIGLGTMSRFSELEPFGFKFTGITLATSYDNPWNFIEFHMVGCLELHFLDLWYDFYPQSALSRFNNIEHS